MKTVEIIERIEGEARLKLDWKDSLVDDARIEFLNFRGYEYILENKAILDALIYTPRICGICGQAHLLATVNAIENLYKNSKLKIEVTPKAKQLRELGLNIETMDSHIKWFYMFIMPDIISLKTKEHTEYKPLIGKKWLASQECASDLIKSLAVIGGQWPHTSYMLPGGVMSDPSLFDISIIEGYLKQTIRFVEDNLLGVSLETYLSFNKIDELSLLNKDLKEFYDISNDNKLYNFGKSYNRFISLSSNHTYNKGRINKKHISNIDLTKIHENSDFTFDINKKSSKDGKYGWAKAVNYMNDYYETGPLARAMINKNELITSIHGEYQDSIPTRVFARIDELIRLLHSSLEIVKKIDVSEASYIKPIQNINTVEKVSASGTCEAARGSLVHEVSIKKGIISKYNVITPTVWNLGPGSKKRPGVAQKALIGSSSSKIAEIILRSFDVCSVCTTH